MWIITNTLLLLPSVAKYIQQMGSDSEKTMKALNVRPAEYLIEVRQITFTAVSDINKLFSNGLFMYLFATDTCKLTAELLNSMQLSH